MSMRYGSVSSGIECAAIAWAPLGWSPAFLAEIDPFASTVLHHHHSSGRPRHMPDPEAPGLSAKDRKARLNAIKAVQNLPERANGVPNFGDMTTYEEWPDADIDVLIGGTPCQAWSVAGLRKGLDDPRGDLTLTYAAIARRYRPRWLVWENVFGVLSHDGGRSFASLLGLLSGRRVEVPAGGWKSAGVVEGYSRAYGLAWVVRDTQYVRVDGFERAIPQRRRRVFVVGYLGDWRRAAAVLFEREGLSGDPAPRRRAQEDVASTVAGGARGRGGYSADDIPLVEQAFGGGRTSGPVDVATALTAHGGPNGRMDFESETFIAQEVAPTLDASYGRLQGASGQDARHGHSGLVVSAVANTLLAKDNDSHAADLDTYVAHTLRAEGFDASEDGTGRGTPIIPIDMRQASRGGTMTNNRDDGSSGGAPGTGIGEIGDPAPTLSTSHPPAIAGAICFNSREDPEVTWDRAGALGASSPQAQAIAYHQREMRNVAPYEADASSVLSVLRREVGTEAYTEWGIGILAALQSPEILQSWLHGESLRGATDRGRPILVGVPFESATDATSRLLHQVWIDGPDGRSPQGRGLAKQLAGEPDAPLSVLPHEGTSAQGGLQHLRSAREGARLLRQALAALQEVGRPAGRKGQSEHAGWAVRRLTPKECARLQGIPADYFDDVIWRGKPAPDGQIYKTLGNGFSANVVRWIGRRIEMVEGVIRDIEAGRAA